MLDPANAVAMEPSCIVLEEAEGSEADGNRPLGRATELWMQARPRPLGTFGEGWKLCQAPATVG